MSFKKLITGGGKKTHVDVIILVYLNPLVEGRL